MVKINLVPKHPSPPPLPRLARRARRLCANLNFRRGEINVVLTTDRQIQKLHRRFLHEDRPTDVMTFSEPPFVDIVISLDTAAAQARARSLRLSEETTLLICHALLHAKGFEDKTGPGRLAMRKMEFETLMRSLV